MSININFGTMLGFTETADLIASCPEIRVHVEGETGIGKSSLIPAISRATGITRCAYIDVPRFDVGDAGMPVLDHEAKVTGFYPNAHFKLHENEPVIIMLDEFSKGAQPVQNMLHPLLEESNPRLGDRPLPEGSIVFTTGNLSGEGLGDGRKSHTINRQSTVRMRKPNAEEWIHNYAVNAGVEGSIIAFVKEVPQVLASYLDGGQDDNPYIYNPRRPQSICATPRSLSRSTHIVRRRRTITRDALSAGLIGTIGEATARDLDAYIQFQNELSPWARIIEDPRGTPVPSSPGAVSVLVFGAVQKVEADTIDAFMQYLDRMDATWQATFCLALAKSSKQKVGFRNASYKRWLEDNQDLL